MAENDLVVRDFIYLDVERLKSILSQVDEGYLEKTDISQTTSGSAKAGAELQIPLLVKAGGTGEYLASNQIAETRTLHDHIYNYVERLLREQNRLFVLHEELDASKWLNDATRADINDTAFVLVTGRPLINDFTHLKSFMADFNKLAGALGRMESSGSAVPQSKAAAKNVKVAGSVKYQIPDQSIKDLGLTLHAFVRNNLIVKILPFANDPNARAVTNLDISTALRMSLDSLIFRFGSAPRNPWTLFGQLASVPLSTDKPYVFGGKLGGALDTSFQGMFDVFRTFEALATSVVYPEIVIVPIALYRGQ